jgi:hypothetical protein
MRKWLQCAQVDEQTSANTMGHVRARHRFRAFRAEGVRQDKLEGELIEAVAQVCHQECIGDGQERKAIAKAHLCAQNKTSG